MAKNYDPSQPPKSHEEKLAWLEKVYGQREMDEDFWCRFYRLMAYVHLTDKDTNLAYVNKALPLLQKKLLQNPKGTDKLEVLYLLGEYHRRNGEKEKAEEYFAQVETVKYKDEDGKKQVGHPYFMGLVKDMRRFAKLKLVPDPARLTVVQRGSMPIPGFQDLIRVKIGDITQDQTLLEIVRDEVPEPIIDTLSVKAGDVIPFKLAHVQHYLSVIELRNFLVGDDFAAVEISTKDPRTRSEDPEESDQSAVIEEPFK